MDMVREEATKSGLAGKLPSGVVLSGGGSVLPGFAMLVKNTVRLPVRMVRPINVDTAVDEVLDPAYTVALGLIVWGYGREGETMGGSGSGFAIKNTVLAKAWAWVKNFMP
jgi:cell division protein FtsA